MNIYIEEVKAEELKSLILTNDELKFKHQDCALYFTSDGSHLYAHDMDWEKSFEMPNNDCFAKGDFVEVIKSHYIEHDRVIELINTLRSVNLILEFADVFNHHHMTFDDFITQTK